MCPTASDSVRRFPGKRLSGIFRLRFVQSAKAAAINPVAFERTSVVGDPNGRQRTKKLETD
jgi:hypothetical protein